MAKLNNVLAKIFGSGAGLNQISKFGSLYAGSPEFTTDPAAAQSLSNYLTGWFASAIGGNSPAIEDMNAVFFAITYQLAYYQQSGLPEWISTKTYYIGSLVNDGSGAIYCSLTDNNTGNLLSDTSNWTKVGGKVLTSLGSLIYGGINGALTELGGNTTTQKQFLVQTGTGSGSAAPAWQDFKPPSVQKFLSGSGTYTKPSGVLYIRLKMVGGGGGGSGGGASGVNGSAGGDSTFGSNITAGGGQQGNFTSNAGASGGTNTISEGTTVVNVDGGRGSGYQSNTVSAGGPSGGISFFGGGSGSAGTDTGGLAPSANSGSGGGGGGTNSASTQTGTGGGAGGYVEVLLTAPSSTYAYSVGAGGNGGAAGSNGRAGASGASGIIIVEEYYQ